MAYINYVATFLCGSIKGLLCKPRVVEVCDFDDPGGAMKPHASSRKRQDPLLVN